MTDGRRIAGVELGGTKAIALIADGPTIIARHVVPTTSPAETLGALFAQLTKWHEQTPFAAIGIASFGPLRLDRTAPDFGHMLATPKSGWSGADIFGALTAPYDCPAAIDTDVNGAALAEQAWGAGVGSDSLCYITIGTGLGGGIVIDGQPVHGAMHPEVGHMLVRRVPGDSFPGICPFHGDCIEGLVSGPALHARFGAPGGSIAQDDPRWAHVAADLAQMIATLLLTTSVRHVLIGGGVGMGRAHLLPLIREQVGVLLAGYLPYYDADSAAHIIRLPGLGADAGPMGAVALALRAII